MFSISVCMIVKNEESVLENCLNSCKSFADEIIIVDTGSTDKTKEIAKKFTNNIYNFKWCDDFSKARNFSFSKATKDYCMWLDADDLILKKDQEKIIKLKNITNSPNAYYFKYVVDFEKNYKPNFYFYRERLLKRNCNFVWQDPVHEVIQIYGSYEYIDICVYHNKKEKLLKIENNQVSRNLNIYQKLIESGISLSPRQNFYYARELFYNNYIESAIKEFKNFLQSNGWIENKIEAYLNLSQCYVLLNNLQSAKQCLFNSFVLDLPRANILLELSNIYIKEKDYITALYWLKQIKNLKKQDKSGAFIQPDYYNFLPYLNMCLCYYHLGDINKALYYHLKCKKLKPNDERVLYNEKFFSSIR